MEKIAITGLGCISAAGLTVDDHWQALEKSRVNCGAVPAWLFSTAQSCPVFAAPENILTSSGALLLAQAGQRRSGQPPGDQVTPLLSRTARLVVSAASEALAGARLSLEDLAGMRVGVALGTTVGCTFNDEEYYHLFRQNGRPDLQPVRQYLHGNLAWCLQAVLGTSGPASVLTNACASGTDAIGLAAQWLASGMCDVAVAGGADELSRIAYNGFLSLQLADTVPCRPFDASRQGLNLGEGAGILVLEREDSCRRRGQSPLGRLLGYGIFSDAYHPTAPHPQGRGLVDAVRFAMIQAGHDTPAMVNAHGTGTKANDQAETQALGTLFAGKDVPPIVSTKGLTGHTLGAAGGIEAVLTLTALRNGMVHGTIGCRDVDPSFAVAPLEHGRKEKLTGRVGLSQSLAFGGGNSAIILEAC